MVGTMLRSSPNSRSESHETTGPGRGPARFKLLASALAGRSVEVASANAGEPSWTDGTTIFIEAGATSDSQLVAVVVQSSLLGAGSLDAEVLSALRRPLHIRRYLAVEGHRALWLHERLLPRSVLTFVNPDLACRTQSARQSLDLASSREHLEAPPQIFGTIRPRRIDASSDRRDGRSADESHIARRNEDRELVELATEETGESEESPETPVFDPFSSPVGGGGGIGRLLKNLFREGRSAGGGPPGADSPTHWSRRGTSTDRAGAFSTSALRIPQFPSIPETPSVTGNRLFTYPEWDVDKKRYKLDWCTVTEVEPRSREGETKRRSTFVPPDSHALRRPLARLGMQVEPYHRQMQGDDVDIDATIEARVELRARSAPTDAVYIDSLKRRRDLSVLVLLDVSGSAGEPSSRGMPVHEHQRSAAWALTVALNELGVRVALYGFRSQGRSAVHVIPLKRFDALLDALVMQHIGELVPGAYTRLGAAIRHGSALIERDAGTAGRLLVVISDGLAYDHGYERSYGEADARRALIEARRRGIGSVCLSVGADIDANGLRRVFGTAAYAAISRVDQLSAVAGPLFRSALRSAELQRKASQRKMRTRELLGMERPAR